MAEIVPEGLDPAEVETNIVFVDVARAGLDLLEAVERLKAEGVLATMVAGKVRMLTHVDVSPQDVDGAIEAWRRVIPALRERSR